MHLKFYNTAEQSTQFYALNMPIQLSVDGRTMKILKIKSGIPSHTRFVYSHRHNSH